jgi:hypothetical protein
MRSRKSLLLAVVLFTVSIFTIDIAAQEALDGRHKIFQDPFLENLAGDWKLPAKYEA